MAEALKGVPSLLVGAEFTPLDLNGVLVGVLARLLASPGALSDPARDKPGRFVRSSRADKRACLSAFLLWRAGECRGQGSIKTYIVGDAKRALVKTQILFASCARSMTTD